MSSNPELLVKNEDGKTLYIAKQNHINKLYSLRNVESRKEELSIKYENSKENKKNTKK